MQINGIYSKTIYTDETGNGTFIVDLEDGGYYQCVGEIPVCYPGTPLAIKGELSDDGDLYVEEMLICSSDRDVLIDFLSGGLFDGIGKILAERIVDALNGEDLFAYIRKYGRLPQVKGLSEARSKLIVDKISGTERMRDFISFCIKRGLSFNEALRIYTKYGDSSYNAITKMPFTLEREKLLNFEQADSLAHESGINHEDPERINAMIFHAMFLSYGMGHVYVTLKGIVNCIHTFEKKSPYTKSVSGTVVLWSLYDIIQKKQLIWEEKDSETRIYLKSAYEAEKTAAKEVERLNSTSFKDTLFDENKVSRIEEELNFKYDTMQRKAFRVFQSPGIKIVTGGPGTGKTTTIKGMIRYIKDMGKEFVLCAPTGRAAQRMSEVCGQGASTIHKLLEIRPYGKDEFICRGKESPIEADYIIVDEMSMVGIELFAKLLNAIKTGATLILVGDIDQLASVTPGNVLKDLIEAGIETYSLQVVFRQKGLSSIAKNASLINKKINNLIQDENFVVKRYENESYERMTEDAVKLFKDSYDEKDLFKCEMISPIKKGDAGVIKLNSIAQKAVNFRDGMGFKEGDRVIFTVNNYEENYFNGDIGIIETIDKDYFIVRLADRTLSLPHTCLQDVMLAYGITIHKSQGSEYDDVIIVLPQCGMLAKNLLYTAVTRAKNRVVILTEGDALEKCIRRDWSRNRNSALKERIKERVG